MALGTVRSILTCADAAEQVAPCPTGQAPALVSAYTLDPSSALHLDPIAEPFDVATGSAFWLAAFMFTVTLYLSTRIYGHILNMIGR